MQGANVFHNPRAKYPLDESFLVGAAYHRFENGLLTSLIPSHTPISLRNTNFIAAAHSKSKLGRRSRFGVINCRDIVGQIKISPLFFARHI